MHLSIVYQHRSRKIFFARDPLGRRSLLVHWPSSGLSHLILASVSTGTSDCRDFAELSTENIYALNLDCLNTNPAMSLDSCLECLPRLTPVDDNSMHGPFVRVALVRSFLTNLISTLRL
jgi:asparagine synthetase B (glutamine-hydrolysing)